MLAGLGKSVRPVTFQHGYQQLWKMDKQALEKEMNDLA
jgi:hypothetical protein